MQKYFVIGRVIAIIAIILLLVVPLQRGENSNVSANNTNKEAIHSKSFVTVSTKASFYPKDFANNEIPPLTHSQLVNIMEQFTNLLVQESNRNYKVLHYDTINALLHDFKTVSTIDVAEKFVDYYYREQEGGLYIVPTETPPWFEKSENYEMIYKDRDTVKIIQQNNSELYGLYRIELEMTYNGNWRLTKVSYS